MVIEGIVLAAGKSTRMGRAKALLPIGDGSDTFLSRVVTTFRTAGVTDIVVVLGHDPEPVRSHARQNGAFDDVRFVLNVDYERGQLTSLVAGLDAIDRPGVDAALVTPVDVPFVTAATVAAVIGRYLSRRPLLVRPVSGDRHGHPVLFDRTLFDELRGADPAQGAKPVVRRHASRAGDVEVSDEAAFTDVDTPAEYTRLTGLSGGRL